jgi:hypothetical protein
MKKSARGKIIDMQALAAKNETKRAVSNVSRNARGDIIDNRGNIKIENEKIQAVLHKDTVTVEETVSIKEDEFEEVETVEEVVEEFEEVETVKEINRELRERKDGTLYYEIEWSDGSMSEESAE